MCARSARIDGWGPGARLRAPGGGPGGGAPGSSEILANSNPQITIHKEQIKQDFLQNFYYFWGEGGGLQDCVQASRGLSKGPWWGSEGSESFAN